MPKTNYTSWQIVFNAQPRIRYSLPLQEVGHEGNVVLAIPLCPLSQFAHHCGVSRGCGEEEQAAVILGVVQALLGQAELAFTDSQLSQLLPLLLRLQTLEREI